jgi:hypothetical protein
LLLGISAFSSSSFSSSSIETSVSHYYVGRTGFFSSPKISLATFSNLGRRRQLKPPPPPPLVGGFFDPPPVNEFFLFSPFYGLFSRVNGPARRPMTNTMSHRRSMMAPHDQH